MAAVGRFASASVAEKANDPVGVVDALALAGLGLVAEQRKEPQKIHKVPENTVKKAVCGRKVG